MRCDFCNSALVRMLGKTKRHKDHFRCPSCELYNAAVAAQQAAAESIAKARNPGFSGRVWLNEYGIFAGDQIGTPTEAAPFVALTGLASKAGRIDEELVEPYKP